jgi:hypothetical protein
MRGWCLTYVPNEDTADCLAELILKRMDRFELADATLTPAVREALEDAVSGPSGSVAQIIRDVLKPAMPGAQPTNAQCRSLARQWIEGHAPQGVRDAGITATTELPPPIYRLVKADAEQGLKEAMR